MTRAELYIAWNDALVDFFITTSTSTVFYVTDSKIEAIGQKYSIDKKDDETFVECYIRAISFFVERGSNANANSKGRICYNVLRKGLFSQLHVQDHFSQNKKESLLSSEFGKNNATLLDFAVFLTKYTILTDLKTKTEFQYPYFSYVILVLLGFNRSENRKWKGVEAVFETNNIYFCNKDREKVASLFEHLINEDKVLTPSCVQTEDPYIKYLKYHSVLKPGDKSLFDEILYNHHIQWNGNMVYGELRDLIWRVGIRSTTQYAKLREALLKTDTRPYFESLIKEFDREEYALHLANEGNANNNTPSFKGCFRYIVDCLSRSAMIWLQYIKPEYAVNNDGITLTPLHVYADNCRVDFEKEVISWADYTNNGISYRHDKYSVSSNKSDLYFFEIIERRFLAEMIEPEQLAGMPCYLIVKSNKRDKQNIINYHNAQQIDILQLSVFDSSWEAYFVPNYVPKQAETDITTDKDFQQLRYAQVCFDNCITFDRKVYLLEAFPYIVTEGIDDPLNDVIITITDIDGEKVPFSKKNVGKRIYLSDFGNVPSGEINLSIKLDGNEDLRSYRVISNAHVTLATDRECARFDKWGCLNDGIQNNYYSDNEVTPSYSTSCKVSNYTPGFNKEEQLPYHRLMSILFSLGNNVGRHSAFSSKDLDNILNYLAGFEGETLTEAEIMRLKYTLRDLGIVTHYYKNGKYYYETNTPRLVPLKEGRSIFNGKRASAELKGLYLLYGTYSLPMYNELYNAVDHLEYKPIEISDKLNKYIPPYIVVALSKGQNIDSIKITNSSLFDELMGFAGNISELEQDENVFRKYSYQDKKEYSYPVMVPSNRERGRKEMLRLSANEVLDNEALSPDLLHTFVRYKHDKPVWFAQQLVSSNCEFYFKSNWKLPFYVRKALVANNYALPKYMYVFGMHSALYDSGEEKKERLFYKMYMHQCDAKDKLKAILGINLCQLDTSLFSSRGLIMNALKSTENGLSNWQLVVYLNNKLLCYTTEQDKVFYYYKDKYVEVTSCKKGLNTINAKLSAVLELHVYCAKHGFDTSEWVKEYLCLNNQMTDKPNFSDCEKYEVRIVKPITTK